MASGLHRSLFIEQRGLIARKPARGIAAGRLGRPVGGAALPTLPGVARGRYDLIAVLDVIEHVEDDVGALRGMAECLAPGGRILITVPAHAWMWSAHDVVNHHHRRYSKASLGSAIAAAGLAHSGLRYFNSLLPLINCIDWMIWPDWLANIRIGAAPKAHIVDTSPS